MRLGFTGAHRSGKTTLADLVATEYGATKVHSPAGQIVKGFGFDMGKHNRLQKIKRLANDEYETTGLNMQLAIYDTLVASLDEAQTYDSAIVSDRTPIDVAAYLLADATGYAGDAFIQEQTVLLVERAIRDTARLFDAVILVPPLPTYEVDPSKPPLNRAYQEHHHMLCRGMLFDDDLDVYWDEIRRDTFDLGMRMDFVRAAIFDRFGIDSVRVAA